MRDWRWRCVVRWGWRAQWPDSGSQSSSPHLTSHTSDLSPTLTHGQTYSWYFHLRPGVTWLRGNFLYIQYTNAMLLATLSKFSPILWNIADKDGVDTNVRTSRLTLSWSVGPCMINVLWGRVCLRPGMLFMNDEKIMKAVRALLTSDKDRFSWHKERARWGRDDVVRNVLILSE